MTEKVVVQNLYKIFGEDPEGALQLLQSGVSKEDIFDRTGQTVGVCDASFAINAGEIFVVMGLSGSGKSTMVRLLNRLLNRLIEPTFGKVLFDGRDIAAMNDRELLELRRKDMSMVFQSFALMPHPRMRPSCSRSCGSAATTSVPRTSKCVKAKTVPRTSSVTPMPGFVPIRLNSTVGSLRL